MTDIHSKHVDLEFTFRQTKEQVTKVYVGEGMTAQLLEVLLSLRPDKVFVVCDQNVEKLHSQTLIESLSKTFEVHKITHQSDEAFKNLDTLASMSDDFFANNGSRQSCIIALGGGITGNIAGFLGSILFRGIPCIQMPTTLISQLDSAVDVKQSVNSQSVKNALGTIRAPYATVVDTTYLRTLNDREIRSGLGEAVKHAFAQDMAFIDTLTSGDLHDPEFLKEVILTTIKLKFKHWENNPTIWNDGPKIERLTHLGHTTGKILELLDIDYLTHGEAIAHGMVIESYAAYLMGQLDKESVEKIRQILARLELLYPLNERYSVQTIIDALYKKGSQPISCLLTSLGTSQTLSVTIEEAVMKDALEWYVALGK